MSAEQFLEIRQPVLFCLLFSVTKVKVLNTYLAQKALFLTSEVDFAIMLPAILHVQWV